MYVEFGGLVPKPLVLKSLVHAPGTATLKTCRYLPNEIFRHIYDQQWPLLSSFMGQPVQLNTYTVTEETHRRRQDIEQRSAAVTVWSDHVTRIYLHDRPSASWATIRSHLLVLSDRSVHTAVQKYQAINILRADNYSRLPPFTPRRIPGLPW